MASKKGTHYKTVNNIKKLEQHLDDAINSIERFDELLLYMAKDQELLTISQKIDNIDVSLLVNMRNELESYRSKRFGDADLTHKVVSGLVQEFKDSTAEHNINNAFHILEELNKEHGVEKATELVGSVLVDTIENHKAIPRNSYEHLVKLYVDTLDDTAMGVISHSLKV